MKPSHTIVKILSKWNVYQFSVHLNERVCFPLGGLFILL
jgi:hypothetical protein